MLKLTGLLLIFFVSLSWAQEPPPMGFTPQQQQWMADQNNLVLLPDVPGLGRFSSDREMGTGDLLLDREAWPYAEYEEAGYLIFNNAYAFNSYEAKVTMARHLPENVKLVVYSGSSDLESAKELKSTYAKLMGEDRVRIVYMPQGSRGFWARDGVPVPILRKNHSGQAELSLVDARYYHNFEADEQFGDLFNSPVLEHEFYFEGGNFMANSLKDCIVVNTTATARIPDRIFQSHYACERLIRLPFVKGIGHIDESVKYVSDRVVLTDEPSYVGELEEAGYEVVLLPRPERKFETYVNSLIVNGVVYVPIFGGSKDEEALQVYRDQGFEKVIGIDTVTLSNTGQGSIHCITMTYPDVPLKELLKNMGGHVLL